MPKGQERSLNRTERLFSLVLLLQNKPNLTSRDLAEHFNVSRRTIFRDLRALSESGVPLTYAEDGGYEILEGYQLPPLMLSAREAATLLTGIEFMKQQSDASLREDADEVGLKIRSVLPSNVQEYIDRLQQRTVLDPYWLHAVQAGDDEEGRWHELSQAIAEQHPIHMQYYVPSRDELTKRTVDPLGLVYYTDHWNLIAFDHLREAIRNFRLDRIEKMHVGMGRFERPEGFDLEQYLKERALSPENQRVRIRFTGGAFRWAQRSIPAHIEEKRETDEGTEVTFYFENIDYLSRWVLRYGTRAEVLEPEALREKVRDKALELADRYE